MTEDEAKTKWCPILIIAQPRLSHVCVASACMMWRTYGAPSMADMVVLMQQGYTEEGARNKLQAAYPNGREGHCGLAGKP